MIFCVSKKPEAERSVRWRSFCLCNLNTRWWGCLVESGLEYRPARFFRSSPPCLYRWSHSYLKNDSCLCCLMWPVPPEVFVQSKKLWKICCADRIVDGIGDSVGGARTGTRRSGHESCAVKIKGWPVPPDFFSWEDFYFWDRDVSREWSIRLAIFLDNLVT